MKMFAQTYFKKFRCIASACRHSCCVDWEIDVDEDTLDYYNLLGDEEITEKLTLSEDGSACFKLGKDGRCPFLNEDNLCRIIIKYGEEALCNICYEHPRFYNYYNGRGEAGIGLCCEEAARLIIENQEPFSLAEIEDDGENEPETDSNFDNLRNELISIIENKNLTLSEVFDKLSFKLTGHKFSFNTTEVASFLFSLERLYPETENMLNLLQKSSFNPDKITENSIENGIRNLLAYFVYRYYIQGLENNNIKGYMMFSLFSAAVIMSIYSEADDKSIESLEDIARTYSAEIEYSDENMPALIKYIQN